MHENEEMTWRNGKIGNQFIIETLWKLFHLQFSSWINVHRNHVSFGCRLSSQHRSTWFAASWCIVVKNFLKTVSDNWSDSYNYELFKTVQTERGFRRRKCSTFLTTENPLRRPFFVQTAWISDSGEGNKGQL